MMPSLVLSAALGTGILCARQEPAAPRTATYTNPYIGISFSHPEGWKFEAKKEDVWVTIPLSGGAGVAALQLVPARFQADPDIWQKSQEHINNQMGLAIVRQWQEEILGVPLLMTQVRSGPGKLASALRAVPSLPSDQTLVTVAGLVYSATPRKLLFRLTAAESAFSEAEFLWRKALESLRTADGKIPTAESPERKPDPIPEPGKRPELPPKVVPIGGGGSSTSASGASSAVQRAPKAFEATAANRKVTLFYPEGWEVTRSEEGKLHLKHAESGAALDLGIYSTLDSDPPMRALIKASAQSLKAFDEVVSRDETLPAKNRAGAMVARVFRTGKGKTGPLVAFEAVGGSNDFYFLLAWQKDGVLPPAIKKLFLELIDRLSVEPAA